MNVLDRHKKVTNSVKAVVQKLVYNLSILHENFQDFPSSNFWKISFISDAIVSHCFLEFAWSVFLFLEFIELILFFLEHPYLCFAQFLPCSMHSWL